MNFSNFIKDSDGELQQAVSKGLDKTVDSNPRKKKLWPHYLQYKIFKSTHKLVYATWALAIATIILALITAFI